ncbi:MAG: lipoprotein [Bacteroidetes bacterium]|nr:lipoprotein [Bacteroidota bacterium]
MFFIFPLSLFSQTQYFEKKYGTPGDDYSRSVKQLSSGSIYVLGNSTAGIFGNGDVSITKLDNSGNEIWTNYYGTGGIDNGFFLNTTSDGNFVFIAESEAGPNNLDILISKIDTAGGVVWNKSFSTPVNETPRYIEQTSDLGFIICGTQNDLVGYNDILVIKLDANGDHVWDRTYGRNDNEYSDMIHQTGTDYILTADTKSYGEGGYDVILYKLDSLGNEIWSQTYGDSLQNGCQGLLMVSDGNYLSYGETEIYTNSPYDFFLEKIDPNGDSIWQYTYGGIGTDALFSVKEDSDGGFVCTGYSNSETGSGPLDLVIMKVDQNGIFQWQQTYGGAGIDIGYEIIKAEDNSGFIITGQTFNVTNEYYLLKVNPDGIIGVPTLTNDAVISEGSPNPCNDIFSIEYHLNYNANAKIVVYNILGESIWIKDLSNQDGTVTADVSGWIPGIYLYGIEMNGRVFSAKKLIVTSH